MTIDEMKMKFGNTFKVDSNVKGAEVIYIVDPYDQTKDITCTTPCTITIPWEPQRLRANKAKLLVRKEGYRTLTVPFKAGIKGYISQRLSLALVVGIAAGVMLLTSSVSLQALLLLGIAFTCMYSPGSEDLYVELEQEE